MSDLCRYQCATSKWPRLRPLTTAARLTAVCQAQRNSDAMVSIRRFGRRIVWGRKTYRRSRLPGGTFAARRTTEADVRSTATGCPSFRRDLVAGCSKQQSPFRQKGPTLFEPFSARTLRSVSTDEPICAKRQPPATIPPSMNTHDTQCSNVLPKIPRRAAAQLEQQLLHWHNFKDMRFHCHCLSDL